MQRSYMIDRRLPHSADRTAALWSLQDRARLGDAAGRQSYGCSALQSKQDGAGSVQAQAASRCSTPAAQLAFCASAVSAGTNALLRRKAETWSPRVPPQTSNMLELALCLCILMLHLIT